MTFQQGYQRDFGLPTLLPTPLPTDFQQLPTGVPTVCFQPPIPPGVGSVVPTTASLRLRGALKRSVRAAKRRQARSGQRAFSTRSERTLTRRSPCTTPSRPQPPHCKRCSRRTGATPPPPYFHCEHDAQRAIVARAYRAPLSLARSHRPPHDLCAGRGDASPSTQSTGRARLRRALVRVDYRTVFPDADGNGRTTRVPCVVPRASRRVFLSICWPVFFHASATRATFLRIRLFKKLSFLSFRAVDG
jgi:hypothetical protein